MLGNIDYRNLVDYSHPHLRDCELLLKALPTLRGNYFYDLSPHGRHGTLTNMDPATDWIISQRGIVLDSDGVNDYVNCGTVNDFNYGTTGSVSWMGWIRLDGTQPDSNFGDRLSVPYAKGTVAGANPGFGVLLLNEYARVQIRDASNNIAQVIDGPHINDGGWHLVGGVLDRTAHELKLYVDGMQRGSTVSTTSVGSISNTGVKFCLGLRRDDTVADDWHFDGQLDDVRVYSRALTAEEIAAIYLDTLGMRYSWIPRVGAGLPVMSYYSAATPAELSASATLAFAPTAALAKHVTLSANSTLTVEPTANLSTYGPLSANATLTFTPSAKIRPSSQLAAAATLTFTPTADVAAVVSLRTATTLAHPILGVTILSSRAIFVIAGDQRTQLAVGEAFTVYDSLANDGTYTISEIHYLSGSDHTYIIVPQGMLTGSEADGTLTAGYPIAPDYRQTRPRLTCTLPLAGSDSVAFSLVAYGNWTPVPLVANATLTFAPSGSLIAGIASAELSAAATLTFSSTADATRYVSLSVGRRSLYLSIAALSYYTAGAAAAEAYAAGSARSTAFAAGPSAGMAAIGQAGPPSGRRILTFRGRSSATLS